MKMKAFEDSQGTFGWLLLANLLATSENTIDEEDHYDEDAERSTWIDCFSLLKVTKSIAPSHSATRAGEAYADRKRWEEMNRAGEGKQQHLPQKSMLMEKEVSSQKVE